jgi:hypothetical protein
MKKSLGWKFLLVSPSILGITLAATVFPSLAQVNPSDETTAKPTTISSIVATPTSTAPISEQDSDAKDELSQPSLQSVPVQHVEPSNPLANDVSLKTSASDLSGLQATNALNSQLQLQKSQNQLDVAPFQFSDQTPIAISNSISTSTVRLDELAAGLAASGPIFGISPLEGTSDHLLLSSQDTGDCQIPGLSCPLPGLAQNSISPTDSSKNPDKPEVPPTTEGSESTSPTESSDKPQATPAPDESQAETSPSPRWHFLFQPYVYVPVTIYGDATFGRFTRDFAVDGNQIVTALKDSFIFGFLGDLQAWTPNYHLGLIANVNYLATGSESTFTRSVRCSCSTSFIPTELKADVNTEALSIDLAAAYRFYDKSKVNPNGTFTEFDLGTFLFDVIGGLNITSVSTDINLTTDLGGEADFDGSNTVVSPLLGGRLRVNVARRLALVTAGTVSGFGISGLTQWGALAGLDWMFSGNTSVGLGYRFGYLNFNKNLDSGRDFGVVLNQNGPYLSFSFRF